MRKLYQEYFYIPKGGKVREKVMLARVATTVVIVVLCLAAMGFTAYAYFSDTLTYGSNTITAANFDIEVTLNGEVLTTRSGEALVAKLTAGETYDVVLRPAGTAKTGFVIVSAKGYDGTYYTTQLDADPEQTRTVKELHFTIKADRDTTVSFLAHLGTSSFYDKYKEIGSEFFIDENGSIVLASGAGEAPKEDVTDPETPSVSAPENTTNPPAASGPAESSKPETTAPAGPAEDPAPEPSDPAEGSVPETPETPEPAEPETPATEPDETTEPAEGEPETTEDPAEGPVEQPVDEPVE